MAWNDVDTICENCGNIKVKAKGFNKQNLKRLLKPFPQTESEWTMLICLILIILIMFAYKADTQVCRDYAKQIEGSFLNLSGGSYSIPIGGNNPDTPFNLNLTAFNLTDG